MICPPMFEKTKLFQKLEYTSISIYIQLYYEFSLTNVYKSLKSDSRSFIPTMLLLNALTNILKTRLTSTTH